MKKLLPNASLCLIVFCLYATCCDFRSLEERQQEEISYFIINDLEAGLVYEPVAFSKVDTDFLMKDGKIRSMMLMVQDTVQMKLNIAEELALTNEKIVVSLIEKSTKLDIEGLDELILESAQLDALIQRHLKRQPHSAKTKFAFETVIAQMDQQLSTLNDRLGDFNLSVYHIDLESSDTDLFYHEYLIKSGATTQSFQKIFELDRNTVQIRAVNDIFI